MDRPELPHLLLIDVTNTSDGLREALAFGSAELSGLLARAELAGAPLAILAGRELLALLSTRSGHVRAFAPVLARLRERTRRVAGLGALRVRALSGSDVARWAVRSAVGLEAGDGLELVATLHGAAALAARAGTLSPELTDLIQLVERARARVQTETRFAYAGASSAELELERFAAQRVVEEEIVEWQFSAPELRAASVPVPALGDYTQEEAQSTVRMRVARVLDKLGVA